MLAEDFISIEVHDPRDGSQFTYQASTEKSALHSIRNQLESKIQVGCKGGGCGVCKIKVHKGNYTAKKMSAAHISQQDLEDRVVLACRIVPQTDLVVETIPIKKKPKTTN